MGEKEIVAVNGEFSPGQVTAALNAAALPGMEVLSVSDNLVNLAFAHSDKIPALLEVLFNHHVKVADLKIKSPNLEAVFLKLTGRSLRD